jgi:rRNA maturation endonuclease Nob1
MAFSFPCSACEHRDKRDYVEPCRSCGHNANQERDPSPQPSLEVPKNAGRLECVWAEDENGIWGTGCGHTFETFTDSPSENGFKFCPYCGKQVKEQSKETDDAAM